MSQHSLFNLSGLALIVSGLIWVLLVGRKKRHNRRLPGNFVLQVKHRSDQARAGQFRMAMLAVSIFGGTFLGLYLLWQAGSVVLDVMVYRNKDFAVASIEVQADDKNLQDEIRAASRVRPGMNLIGLDLAAVKQNVEKISQADSVSVERALPHTLRIRVTERTPVAQVNVLRTDGNAELSVKIFQLDASGMVMLSPNAAQTLVPLAQAESALPVITGIDPLDLRPGCRLDMQKYPQVPAALQLIAAFKKSAMVGLEALRYLNVSSPGVVVATTGMRSQITFAPDDFDQQLRRWRSIYDYGKSANRGDIIAADLAVANNVPVRWTLASDTPAPAPSNKPKPNSKTRRKNV